ncbi:hypothetical protein HZA43_03865 [Candidatus Peregrinibacteria bacterium]|nr:hypothetical protein [Candidatus Peregrinibacteria bacterium]
MIRWRNDRTLEPERKKRMQSLEEENRELRATVADQQRIIEKLLLRVEQLETMVFGRKKESGDNDDLPPSSSGTPVKRPRPAASFRRAVPTQDEIDTKTYHPLRSCPDCGRPIGSRETVTRFVEDIPPARKVITERTIERGFCFRCKKTKSAHYDETGYPVQHG